MVCSRSLNFCKVNPFIKTHKRVSQIELVEKLQKPVAKGLANSGALNMSKFRFIIVITGLNDKKNTSVVMQKFEQSSEYQVVINMMEELHSVDQFRILQRNEFASRDLSEEFNGNMDKVKPIRTEQDLHEAQDIAFLKFQKSYLKQCK